jgi:hypothetical protein
MFSLSNHLHVGEEGRFPPRASRTRPSHSPSHSLRVASSIQQISTGGLEQHHTVGHGLSVFASTPTARTACHHSTAGPLRQYELVAVIINSIGFVLVPLFTDCWSPQHACPHPPPSSPRSFETFPFLSLSAESVVSNLNLAPISPTLSISSGCSAHRPSDRPPMKFDLLIVLRT